MEFYSNIPNNPQMMNPPINMMMGMGQMEFLNMDYNTNKNNINNMMISQSEQKKYIKVIFRVGGCSCGTIEIETFLDET